MLPGTARGQTVTIIRSFGSLSSITFPQGPPVQGRDGKLYAETDFSTPTVFKEQTNGNTALLYNFGFAISSPEVPVLLGNDGNWYGTTEGPGLFPEGGLLYRISPDGVYTILHSFSTTTNGAAAVGSVIEVNGKLYGTTVGDNLGVVGPSVYSYDLSTGTFATVYEFNSSQLFFIGSALLHASDGNLYGLGSASDHCGAAFKMTPSGKLLNIYSFDCSLDVGINEINAPLVEGSDGNFYGTGEKGGSGGSGSVFKMDRSGNVSVLHYFGADNDGINPGTGLVAATDGNLYGTTTYGQGNAGNGIIYQISTSGNYQQIYLWSGFNRTPWGIFQDTDGKFYGYLIFGGGAHGTGAFYSLDMDLGPFITFVSSTGAVGQVVQILGQGLTGSSGVTFNGVPATKFTVAKDTFMTAVVPSGATTGPVVVTTPTGTLTSNKSFSVMP
jgi:uncharacterized repeat protein (TIGR03803 family)